VKESGYELFHITVMSRGRRGSSVSIVSDYGLDDRAIGFRSPAGAKNFSFNLCVQTGSGAHPASCTMGTGGTFPGAKRGRSVTLITHPHLVPKSIMSRSYTSSPPRATMACSGTTLLFFLLCYVKIYFYTTTPNGQPYFHKRVLQYAEYHHYFRQQSRHCCQYFKN
jgi:hypothetical protein